MRTQHPPWRCHSYRHNRYSRLSQNSRLPAKRIVNAPASTPHSGNLATDWQFVSRTGSLLVNDDFYLNWAFRDTRFAMRRLQVGEAYFNLLRSMPVFGGLNDLTLEAILERANLRLVREQEFFFREGDEANSFFVLESGSVVVERLWMDSAICLGVFRSGDCFGEMAVIDLLPRSASVRAVEECSAIEITHQSLFSLYQQEPEQYAIIMMNMGREVSRRLRLADDRLFQLEQESKRAGAP